MERATDQIKPKTEGKSRKRQLFDFYTQSSRSEFLVFMVLILLVWVVFYFTDRLVITDTSIVDGLILRFVGFVITAVVFYFMLNHARTPFAWDVSITICMCVLCLGWVALLLQSKSQFSPLYPCCSVAFVGVISLFVTRYIGVAVLGMAFITGMTAYVLHEKFSAIHPNILIELTVLSLPLLIFFLTLTWQNWRRVEAIFDFHVNTREQRKRLIRDNDKLRENASTDALTNLPNRSSFEASHAALMAQKKPFGLLIIDIDHFKMINESYGHGVGDGVIVKIASSINAVLSDEAALFSLGGEEFVVLVEDTDEEDLRVLAHTLVTYVKNLCIPHNARPDTLGLVTVSIGGCICDPDDIRGLKAHLERADHNIYDAKSKGHNTFVI